LTRIWPTYTGVSTEVLNQAVKRHKDRFREDFMFQLSMEEAKVWWSEVMGARLRSQFVTLKRGQHIKYRPYAFTEHGILMLSSVLNSERAHSGQYRDHAGFCALAPDARISHRIRPQTRCPLPCVQAPPDRLSGRGQKGDKIDGTLLSIQQTGMKETKIKEFSTPPWVKQ